MVRNSIWPVLVPTKLVQPFLIRMIRLMMRSIIQADTRYLVFFIFYTAIAPGIFAAPLATQGSHPDTLLSENATVQEEQFVSHPDMVYLGCDYFSLTQFRGEVFHNQTAILMNEFQEVVSNVNMTIPREVSLFGLNQNQLWQKRGRLDFLEGYDSAIAYDSYSDGLVNTVVGAQYKIDATRSRVTEATPVYWLEKAAYPLPLPAFHDQAEMALIPIKMNAEFIVGWAWPYTAATDSNCMFSDVTARPGSITRPYLVLWEIRNNDGGYQIAAVVKEEDISQFIDLGEKGELLYVVRSGQKETYILNNPLMGQKQELPDSQGAPIELFYGDPDNTDAPEAVLMYSSKSSGSDGVGTLLYEMATATFSPFTANAPDPYYQTRPLRENHFSGKRGVRCYHTARVYDEHHPGQAVSLKDWKVLDETAPQKSTLHLYDGPGYCAYPHPKSRQMVFSKSLDFIKLMVPSFIEADYDNELGSPQVMHRDKSTESLTLAGWYWTIVAGWTPYIKFQMPETK